MYNYINYNIYYNQKETKPGLPIKGHPQHSASCFLPVVQGQPCTAALPMSEKEHCLFPSPSQVHSHLSPEVRGAQQHKKTCCYLLYLRRLKKKLVLASEK